MGESVKDSIQPAWRIELLGELRVVHGSRVVTRFRSRQTGLLLASLAYHLPRPQRREQLAELLWPESDPSTALANLRNTLRWLRQELEPPGVPAGTVLLADRATLQLNPAAVTTDVTEFEAALAAARAGSSAERAQCIAEAVDLYRGELLPGFYDDWILQERGWLAERYFQALSELTSHLERGGEWGRALEYGRRGVRADPLRQEAHRSLIRLLTAAGQREAALCQCAELERLQERDLGDAPSDEDRALASTLRKQVASATPVPEPPLLSAPSAPLGNLPLPLDRFFGRRPELARLIALLRPLAAKADGHEEQTDERVPVRLITLTGAGGSGKTRLALELARRLQQRRNGQAPAGCWFVPLADLTDPRLVPDKLLDALRLPRHAGSEPLEQVVAALSRQPSLLLLDNMEHLLPEGAVPVRALLERVDTLTVLVTSRHRVGLPGEHLLPVPPLPVPAATDSPEHLRECVSVQLFLDRVQAVRRDFRMTPANEAAVADLCRQLEGIPLALELAAARIGVLTPAQMLERLNHRFALLANSGNGVGTRSAAQAGRHRSLRAALDWSYWLLPPELQRFFAQLSIFRGGWDLEAAETVCQQSQALDYLSTLCESSLVLSEERPEGMRYRLLETLREYGAEQLAIGEKELLAQQHAGYFLALAERAESELQGPDQGAWLARLDREHDNLRAVLDGMLLRGEVERGLLLGGTLGRFWEVRGYPSEGRRRLEQFLTLAGAAETSEARVSALQWAGILARRQGEPEAARSLLEESLMRARALRNEALIARSLHQLGITADWQGNLPAARCFLEESLAIRRALGDRHGAAATNGSLGMLARQCGDCVLAGALLEEHLNALREAGDLWGIANALFSLGWVAQDQDEHASAHSLFEQSRTVYQQLGSRAGELHPILRLGQEAYRLGDFPAARAFLTEGLMLARAMVDRVAIAHALLLLGNTLACEDEHAAAEVAYTESLALWRELSMEHTVAGMLTNLARTARCQGALIRARGFLRESLEIFRRLQDARGLAECLEASAGVAVAEGRPERAAWLLGAAAALREGGGGAPWPADRIDNERNMAGVRAIVDEAAFADAWEAGRGMSLEEAMAEALADP
jgi:predicted ATPase/DNA-binding SARP family transcriptional activator